MTLSLAKKIAFVIPAAVLSIAWLGLLMLTFTIKADTVTEPSNETHLTSGALPSGAAQNRSVPTPSNTEIPIMTTSSPEPSSLPPAGAPPANALTLDASAPDPEPSPPDAGLPAATPEYP